MAKWGTKNPPQKSGSTIDVIAWQKCPEPYRG